MHAVVVTYHRQNRQRPPSIQGRKVASHMSHMCLGQTCLLPRVLLSAVFNKGNLDIHTCGGTTDLPTQTRRNCKRRSDLFGVPRSRDPGSDKRLRCTADD